MLSVREFEPSLFEPGVYFNIKCIGKLPGPTNEFERSLVFETGEFERPKFDCNIEQWTDMRYNAGEILFFTFCLSICLSVTFCVFDIF